MKAGKYLIFICLAIVSSCTRPPSDEKFIVREKAEYGDTYPFELDLTDTTFAYGISLFARIEKEPFGSFRSDSLKLCLSWISPAMEILQDTMYMDLSSHCDSSYFARDYIFPLPGASFPEDPGVWRLKVKVPDHPEHLNGVGVILKRNAHGTR